MAVYRFRVTFEDQDDVWREVEIKSTQTFDDFQQAIHSYIGFDSSKSASFYISNDNWKKGKEITSRDLKSEEKEKVSVMRSSKLVDFIADPHQKIYYVFDPVVQWAFRIELVKIIVNEEAGASYPRCIKTVGEAPKQYGPILTGPPPEPEDFDETTAELESEEDTEVETGIEEDIPSILVKDEEELVAGEADSGDEEELIEPGESEEDEI